MKKTNLTRSLLAACSIVALSAVMYGCSSSGNDDTARSLEEAQAALAALEAALLPGTELSPEALMALQSAKEAAEMDRNQAITARGEALDAQEEAEGDLQDAVVDRAAAVAAKEAAERERDTALTARDMAQSNLMTTQSDLDDAESALMTAESALMTTQSDLDDAESALMTAESALMTTQSDLDDAESALMTTQSDLEDAESERDSLQEQLTQAQTDAEADQQTIDGLNMQITMKDGEIEDLNTDISGLNDTIDEKNGEIGDLNMRISGLNGTIDEKNGEIGNLNTQITSLNDTITQKIGEIGDLNTRISGLNNEIGTLTTQVTTLTSRVTAKDTEIGGLRTQISGLQDDISDLEDEVGDLEDDIAEKNTEIARLNKQISDAADDTVADKQNFRAHQIASVISRYMNDPDDNEASDGTDQIARAHHSAPAFLEMRLADSTVTPAIEVRSANNQIMAHVEVAANGSHLIDEDEDDDTDSGYKPVGSPPSLGGLWRGRILEEELPGGSTNHIVAWSNVEASTAESFKTAYGGLPDERQAFTDWRSANAGLSDTAAAAAYLEYVAAFDKIVSSDAFEGQRGPGVADYNDAPMIADDDTATIHVDSAAAFWGLASASGFPAKAAEGKGANTETYFGPGEDPANEDLEDSNGDGDITVADDGWNPDGQMVSGSFDGVSGTYECMTANGCVVRHNNRGMLSSLALNEAGDATDAAADWEFTANNAAGTVITRRGDDDYMTFGFWLLKPDAEEGTHQFATFFAGRDMLTANPTVTGDAKYEGPAAGKYATRPRDSDDGKFGVFRADATLTADFDDNMISGTVTNFVGENGASLGDWNVVLKGDDAAAEVEITAAAFNNEQVGGAADGRDWETGAWSGQFYDDDHVYTDEDDVTFAYPGSVAGEFHARWGTPTQQPADDLGFVGVAGGFGAEFTEQVLD
jgi:predicted  nucleic acid-binding Zn-ribbon protein